MRYLLDTHVWLWAFTGDLARFGPRTAAILNDGQSDLYLSAVTSWEISIKWALRRLELTERPEQLIARSLRENRLIPLAITHEQAWLVGDLAAHHSDPFDRLLVAQAMRENLTLVTADPLVRHYPVAILWAHD